MEVLPAEGSNSGDGLKDSEKGMVKMNGSVEGMEVDDASRDSDVPSDESVCGSSRVGATDENETNSHVDDAKSNSHFESEGEGEGKSHIESDGEGKSNSHVESDGEGKSISHVESDGEGKSNSHFGSEYEEKHEEQAENMDVDGLADGEGESVNSEEEDNLLNSDNEQSQPRSETQREDHEPVDEEEVESDDDEEGDVNGEQESAKENQEGKVSETTPNGELTPTKKKKTSAAAVNLTPRRSSRTVQKPVRFGQENMDSDEEEEADANADSDDVEEIQASDPLADPLGEKATIRYPRMIGNTTIVVNDSKRLADIAAQRNAQAKKEATLVIIDTNSILSGRGGVPMTTPGGVTITQQPANHAQAKQYPPPSVTNYPPKPKPPQILPSLTDDMYVVEAPSFIVPYVYEKPPVKKFRKYLRKMLKQVRKQEEERQAQEDKEDAEEEERAKLALEESKKKEAGVKEEPMEEDKIDIDENRDKIKEEIADEEEAKEKPSEKMDTTEDKKEEKEEDEKKPDDEAKPADDVDKEKNDSTEVDKKPDLTKIDETAKKETVESSESEDSGTEEEDEKKKPPNTGSYFANPLGKFFMTIGMNLVQEFVQTDLLKQQKKKQKAGKGTDDTQAAINSLKKNLQMSKENNEPYTMRQQKCEFCSFKTESKLIMAHHLETPHMRNYVYRCNFCPLEVRGPHDILLHMEAEHMVRGRLERAPAFHQCPQCPFEDNQKGKLTRHLLTCAKKFRPEKNLEPPMDWEPPAKIPRVPRKTPAMQPNVNNPLYQQAMAVKNMPQLLPKIGPGMSPTSMMRPRGRPPYSPVVSTPPAKMMGGRAPVPPQMGRANMMYRPPGNTNNSVLLPSQYQLPGSLFQVMGPQGQMMGVPGPPPSLQRLGVPSPSQQQKSNPATVKLLNQPSISITPLPRQSSNPQPGIPPQRAGAASSSKTTFVICEICDGYIKDLEQLRNHMQWIHKVKIHPKMIYNRPPLNCQKCQFRFFTDQGLERHLLGSHGLVTSSMQDSANKGKDGGRCPVCGRVYQWKLLNHVARDHNMTLKPAHLSYKCTVCTATFGMYKQFENHVYSAHSVVAKRGLDKKNGQAPPTSRPDTASLLKPLKINDEITIIPQPAKKPAGQQQRPVPGNFRVNPAAQKARGPDSVQVIDLEDSPHKGGENGSESLTAVKERLKRRKSLEIRQLESEADGDSESDNGQDAEPDHEQEQSNKSAPEDEEDDRETEGESGED